MISAVVTQPFPLPKEWIDQYLNSYLASRGDYGWAGWLLMTAIVAVGVAFLWGVVRNGFNRLADDTKQAYQTLMGLVREAIAAMTAVKTTMDGATIERQVLINKVDAMEAVLARNELVITYQGKEIESLKEEVHRMTDASLEATMACTNAQRFLPNNLNPKPGGGGDSK